jgi:hypothetical protein
MRTRPVVGIDRLLLEEHANGRPDLPPLGTVAREAGLALTRFTHRVEVSRR